MSTLGVDIAAGAARRRRERRLRSWLRHERMTVAMALAEASHSTAPRGQKTARARGWVRDEVHGHVLEAPTPRSPARGTSALTTMTACRSSGARGLTASLVSGRRSESRGASWSRSSTLHPSFLFSTILILCRRWWTQWRKSVASSSSVGRWLPSRLGTVRMSWFSKCPRFFSTWLRPVPLFLSRRRQNSWWQCLGSSSSSSDAPKAHSALGSFALVGTRGPCVCTILVGSHRQPRAVYKYWAQVRLCGHAATYSSSLRWTVDGAFLDRMVDIAVMLRDRYAQCYTVLFLDWLLTCPLLCMSRSSSTLSWRRCRDPMS